MVRLRCKSFSLRLFSLNKMRTELVPSAKLKWENCKPENVSIPKRRRKQTHESVSNNPNAMVTDEPEKQDAETGLSDGDVEMWDVEHQYPYPFLKWNSINWSCAYDSVLTPLYAIWAQSDDIQQAALTALSPCMEITAIHFIQISNAPESEKKRFLLDCREAIRDRLSLDDPVSFPRIGRASISLYNLLEHLNLLNRLQGKRSHYCHSCNSRSPDTAFEWNTMFYETSIACLGNHHPAIVDVQDWLIAQVQYCEGLRCPTCHQSTFDNTNYAVTMPPPVLAIQTNLALRTTLIPTPAISFPNHGSDHRIQYELAAILYHGSDHYTARIFLAANRANDHGSSWLYDGIDTHPTPDSTSPTPSALLALKSAKASFFLYKLSTCSE
jgi:hypothetical protein